MNDLIMIQIKQNQYLDQLIIILLQPMEISSNKPQVQAIPSTLTANLIDYVYNSKFSLSGFQDDRIILDLYSIQRINPGALNPVNPIGYAQIHTTQDSDGQYISNFSQGRLFQTNDYYINLEVNFQHQPVLFEDQGISGRNTSQLQIKIQDLFDTEFTVGMQQVPLTTKYNLLPYFKAPLGSTIKTMPFFEIAVIQRLKETLKEKK